MACERILLGGVVQGVGFRPFVYRLARRFGVEGFVRNQAGLVEIQAAAAPAVLVQFREALLAEAPPAARPKLRAVTRGQFDGVGFAILDSAIGETIQGLPPDLAPCPDCLAEMADPANRRYRYAFTNCTQCGPRYSIIRRLPYDRGNTAMAGFALCPACAGEYDDQMDRRFHAEAVACPSCGPRLQFGEAEGEAALAACLTALRAGRIIAVKGVGGYHLVCDAADEAAIARLRSRKPRPSKPLALLVPERRLPDYVSETHPALFSPARPIILLPRCGSARLAPNIAPGLAEIGVMLADSPLHHLLAEGFGAALVATSANVSGEPMVTDETEAETKLTGIAEGFLHHDRPIDRPIDDSVLRPVAGVARIARSGRGLAPMEFRLPFALGRPVLACGGQTKSTIALGWGKQAVLSPHLGDLDNPAALAAFARMAEDLQALYNMRAEQLVTDAHPNYASTVWASEQGLPVASVWHHHAHASALAGESGETGELLVFTWDAVGLGPDGLLWGGEALLGSPGCWRVAARLRRLKLQGGEAVARDPWRSGAAMCWQAGFEPPEGLVPDPVVFSAWIQALNCHESSAVGRLFDGAAALLGLCRRASYEGEAPARLEALAAAAPRAEAPGLPLAEQDGVLEADWTPLVPVLLDHRLTPAARAAWFHAALAATAIAIAERVGARRVGLSGGVFQNRRLAEAVLLGLRRRGIAPELGRRIPCNDAGLSFGQLVEFGAQRWKM